MRNPLSKTVVELEPSGIRRFFDVANTMENVISLGVGEPDFDTPWHIREEGIYSLEKGRTYYTSNAGLLPLRREISRYLHERFELPYGEEEILVTVGGSEAIDICMRAMLDPGDEVIIPAPFWLSYPEIVKLAGGVPVIVTTTKEQNFKLTAQDLQNAITAKTKAVVINTPNNPTGMLYTEEELRALADVIVKNDIYVVADEMYENLVYGGEKHVSIASFSKEIYDRTITCSGLSKSYAMTGWRIGYTGSSKEIAKMMSSVQSHQTSNPNAIAQKAAVEALNGPQDSVESMHKEFDKRRKYMYERICKMPYVNTIEPKGAFYVFVDANEVLGKSYGDVTVDSVAKMADILINDYNTAVVPCADFGFENHLRLSYAISIEQIGKGLDRIESFLRELK